MSYYRCGIEGCSDLVMLRLNLFKDGNKVGLCEKHVEELSKSPLIFKSKYKFEVYGS